VIKMSDFRGHWGPDDVCGAVIAVEYSMQPDIQNGHGVPDHSAAHRDMNTV